MRVYIQSGCSEPETLVEALIRRAPFVHDVEVIHMMTLGYADYVAPEMAGHFRHNALFIGPNVRAAVNDGRADYTPVNLSEIEELFDSRKVPIDVALVQLSQCTRLLQLWSGRGYESDRGQALRLRGRPSERPNARHPRRQLRPCQPD